MIPFKWEGQVLIWWTDRFIPLNVEYSLGLISDLFTSSILFSAAGLALKFFFWSISFFAIYLLTVLNNSVRGHWLFRVLFCLWCSPWKWFVTLIACVQMWPRDLFFSAFTRTGRRLVSGFPYCSPSYSFETGFSLNLELTLLLDCLASTLWDPLLPALELGECSVIPFYLCAVYFRALFSFPFCNSDKLPCQKETTIMKKEQAFKMNLKKNK